MFVNKFVYSQQGTFQTDLFEDAFNYCHVDNEESSPSSTHKLNCTHTPSSLLRLTSRQLSFPSKQIQNPFPFFLLSFRFSPSMSSFPVLFFPSQPVFCPFTSVSGNSRLENNPPWWHSLIFLISFPFQPLERGICISGLTSAAPWDPAELFTDLGCSLTTGSF